MWSYFSSIVQAYFEESTENKIRKIKLLWCKKMWLHPCSWYITHIFHKLSDDTVCIYFKFLAEKKVFISFPWISESIIISLQLSGHLVLFLFLQPLSYLCYIYMVIKVPILQSSGKETSLSQSKFLRKNIHCPSVVQEHFWLIICGTIMLRE